MGTRRPETAIGPPTSIATTARLKKRKKAEESGRKRRKAVESDFFAQKEGTFSRGKKATFRAEGSDFFARKESQFLRGSKRLSGRKRRKIMNLVYDYDRWANFSRIICIFVLFPVCIPLF